MKEIFEEIEFRNIYSNILKYLSIQDIQSLSLLNKNSNSYIHKIFQLSENQNLLCNLQSKRFFDRNKGKMFIFNKNLGPSCNGIDCSKEFWKKYFSEIDEGDFVYILSTGKFIQINLKNVELNYFLVRHEYDGRKSFPVEYWQHFGKEYRYRLWVHIHVYYDSLKFWMKDKRIKFMGFDLSPELYQPLELIPVSLTYDEDYIYLYYTAY